MNTTDTTQDQRDQDRQDAVIKVLEDFASLTREDLELLCGEELLEAMAEAKQTMRMLDERYWRQYASRTRSMADDAEAYVRQLDEDAVSESEVIGPVDRRI